jgi:hypothetical protein
MSNTSFSLGKSNSIKEFTFLTSQSWIKIIRATITNPKITIRDKDWASLIANCFLEVKLQYVADKEIQMEWSQTFTVHFHVDVFQTQPIIEINKQFHTEHISINNNKDNFYTNLFIKLVQNNSDNSELELKIDYDQYQLKDK